LAALLELAATLGSLDDRDRFGEALLGPLRKLVPADSITYNEIDVRRRRTFWTVDPPGALDDTDPADFVRYVSQHPIVTYSRRTGDGRAHTLSDFLYRCELHRTDLYSTFFRAAKVEHQIAITLSCAPGLIVGVALNRSAHDFTTRDREVLDLARTQIVACFQSLTAAQQNAALLDAMDRALEDERRGVLVVGSDGRLVTASPTAQRMLGTHLGFHPGSGQHLPHRLAALADGSPSRCGPVALGGDRARLYARVLLPAERGQRVIVVDERRLGEVPPLSAAGLTCRERQVLELVAAARSTPDIARALNVSIRTVHKHLEHLYPKLGVHDRTSAATRWLSEHGAWNGAD
ncbi:MAG: hypothetical protein JWO62_1051, partial [Acidimicrobiaceae bacterium]|nr:hypothetical protein [Acidimicrobiaceae bacterium]